MDAAQSILDTPAAAEARRFERALAECNRAAAVAMVHQQPGSGAGARDLMGGTAIFAGRGSPLTQGLGMGLAGPISPAELDAFESFVRPDGSGAVQLEICPFIDPSLPAELARRGYRVHEWQLAWSRPAAREPLDPAPPGLRITAVGPGDAALFCRVTLAGMLESEDVPAAAIELIRPFTAARGYELFLAWLGDEPIGGGTLACIDGVGLLNGSGVRPAFRRRGAQGALMRVRMARATELGCDTLYSNTLPGTASRRNMERHGFSVAYPKLVMLKDS